MKNRLVWIIPLMCVMGISLAVYGVVLVARTAAPIIALLDVPEKVVAVSVSPDKRYEAFITVVGGGALGSDVYRARIRERGAKHLGDQVGQVSQNATITGVHWRHDAVLIIEWRDRDDFSHAKWDGVHQWRNLQIDVRHNAPEKKMIIL